MPSPLRTIGLGFLATRLAVVAIGVLSLSYVSVEASNAFANCVSVPPAPKPLEMWSRWDAQLYLTVVERGYGGTLNGYCDMRPSRFPLYPALVWITKGPLGSALLAGIVVSNLAFALFLFALWRLVAMDYGRAAAARTIWLYLVFPSSFFLSGVYAESVVLAATAGALLAARAARWWIAGFLTAVASLSHPVGMLAAVPVLTEYVVAQGFDRHQFRVRDIVGILGPSLVGFSAYLVFSAQVFGDPLAFLSAEQDYRGALSWPGQAFVRFWESGPRWHGYDNSMFDASLAVLATISLPLLFRRVRLSYALYATAIVLLPLCTSLVSFSRIILAAFPCFILLALLTSRRSILLPILAVSAALLAVFTVMFASWRWVA